MARRGAAMRRRSAHGARFTTPERRGEPAHAMPQLPYRERRRRQVLQSLRHAPGPRRPGRRTCAADAELRALRTAEQAERTLLRRLRQPDGGRARRNRDRAADRGTGRAAASAAASSSSPSASATTSSATAGPSAACAAAGGGHCAGSSGFAKRPVDRRGRGRPGAGRWRRLLGPERATRADAAGNGPGHAGACTGTGPRTGARSGAASPGDQRAPAGDDRAGAGT